MSGESLAWTDQPCRPPDDVVRLVGVGCYYQDLPVAQVASALGVAEGTVKRPASSPGGG
jgi:hypothetical protein